jgi:hypothetical protein
MKSTYIIFAIIITAVYGCEKKLDLAPVTNPTVNTFYKTPEDAAAAVTGVYSILEDIYTHEAVVTPNMVSADDAVPFLQGNADRRAIWSYNFVSTNSFINNPWALSYQGIQRANVVISRMPGISLDENLKKRYIAEAKFIRAIMYFNLVRFYGGVPIVTNETTSLENVEVPRSTKDEVYALIETDLKEAEAVLPVKHTGTDIGRATQGAARGLLAKVYLTQAGNEVSSPNWAKAAAKAKEVMDMGIYDLWENYADVFDIRNKVGKESLFEVLYLTDVNGNWHTTYWAPRGDPRVPSNGFGTVRPTKNLYDLYAANDKRKPVTFLTSYVNPTNGATVNLSIDDPNPAVAISFWKLADLTSKVGGGGGKSFPYLRFPDILLVYAEALNEVNGPVMEAYAALNRVRARAGLAPLSGLTKAQFKDAVLTERRLEFVLEGNRWFDLVRTGRLVDAVKAETSFGRNPLIQPHHVLFPIPQREIGANTSLVQNPGY